MGIQDLIFWINWRVFKEFLGICFLHDELQQSTVGVINAWTSSSVSPNLLTAPFACIIHTLIPLPMIY